MQASAEISPQTKLRVAIDAHLNEKFSDYKRQSDLSLGNELEAIRADLNVEDVSFVLVCAKLLVWLERAKKSSVAVDKLDSDLALVMGRLTSSQIAAISGAKDIIKARNSGSSIQSKMSQSPHAARKPQEQDPALTRAISALIGELPILPEPSSSWLLDMARNKVQDALLSEKDIIARDKLRSISKRLKENSSQFLVICAELISTLKEVGSDSKIIQRDAVLQRVGDILREYSLAQHTRILLLAALIDYKKNPGELPSHTLDVVHRLITEGFEAGKFNELFNNVASAVRQPFERSGREPGPKEIPLIESIKQIRKDYNAAVAPQFQPAVLTPSPDNSAVPKKKKKKKKKVKNNEEKAEVTTVVAQPQEAINQISSLEAKAAPEPETKKLIEISATASMVTEEVHVSIYGLFKEVEETSIAVSIPPEEVSRRALVAKQQEEAKQISHLNAQILEINAKMERAEKSKAKFSAEVRLIEESFASARQHINNLINHGKDELVGAFNIDSGELNSAANKYQTDLGIKNTAAQVRSTQVSKVTKVENDPLDLAVKKALASRPRGVRFREWASSIPFIRLFVDAPKDPRPSLKEYFTRYVAAEELKIQKNVFINQELEKPKGELVRLDRELVALQSTKTSLQGQIRGLQSPQMSDQLVVGLTQ